jgi:hypothetical protein
MKLLLSALLALFFVGPVAAQSGDARCLSTPGHLVAAAENDDVGESFAIYHKASETEVIPCRFDRDSADLVFEGTYALEALTGDTLILSEGTSTVRTLLVFDLIKGKRLLSSEAEYGGFTGPGIAYWERREPATADNCAQFAEFTGYGGSGVIAHELVFSLATRQSTETGQTRCTYLE